MKTLEEHNEELRDIMEASLTHTKRFFILCEKYTKEICDLSEWMNGMLVMPPERNEEFHTHQTNLLHYLEELGESVQDIGSDIERMGEHGKSFCEAVIEELKDG